MRKGMIAAVLFLLAGCAAPARSLLAEGPPSADFARTALSDGAPEMALNVSDGLLRTRPEDTQTLLVRAGALAQLDRRGEAERVFRQVLARDPGSVDANMGLGRLLLASDPAGAEALFDKANSLRPNDAAALDDLGIARDLQGHHAEAQTAYRQALSISPDLSAATTNLALSLSLSGHAAEAMQLLKRLAETPDAQPRLRYDLAAIATMAGERQSAEALLKNDLPPEKLQAALDGFAALSVPPL